MSNKIKLEIIAQDIESATLAQEAGADRLELCTNLSEGGTTLSTAHTKVITQNIDIPVVSLIRPRAGGFHYSEKEKTIYLKEIEAVLKAGVNGIVVGMLNKQLEIDFPFLIKIINSFPDVEMCFHRAFDLVNNPSKMMHELIQLNINRILTSGQQPTAWKGRHLIQSLIQEAGNQIEILPGSGITSTNASDLIELTKCKSIHASAKKQFIEIKNGIEFPQYQIDQNELIALRSVIN